MAAHSLAVGSGGGLGEKPLGTRVVVVPAMVSASILDRVFKVSSSPSLSVILLQYNSDLGEQGCTINAMNVIHKVYYLLISSVILTLSSNFP